LAESAIEQLQPSDVDLLCDGWSGITVLVHCLRVLWVRGRVAQSSG
jgi:hypothetical protein